MGKTRLRGLSPTYIHPSLRDITPPLSVHEDWEADTAMDNSRPSSMAIPRTASPAIKPPSLSEILANTAPPPWTLSAFTAYLSQNHCLETLEFVMEAERYSGVYDQISMAHSPGHQQDVRESASLLWQKIMQTFILSYGPREVNLPSPVRDRLLKLECSPQNPPLPSELYEAVRIVHELMNDSVLVPFLQSMPALTVDTRFDDEASEARSGRPRLRIPKDLSSPDDSSSSPKAGFLPIFGLGRGSMTSHRSPSANASAAGSASASEPLEGEGLTTDDTNSPNSTPSAEPMTPPTTPPTSDFTFNPSSSPNTLQRAISGNWKKMGNKLGLNRKSRSMRRSQPTNIPSTSQEEEPIPEVPKASEWPL